MHWRTKVSEFHRGIFLEHFVLYGCQSICMSITDFVTPETKERKKELRHSDVITMNIHRLSSTKMAC